MRTYKIGKIQRIQNAVVNIGGDLKVLDLAIVALTRGHSPYHLKIQRIQYVVNNLSRDVKAVNAAIAELERDQWPRGPTRTRLSTQFPHQRRACHRPEA